MSDDDDREYEVGYRKPPKNTQFKKGQSGNRKGRPKSVSKDKTDYDAVMEERLWVEDPDGRRRSITTGKAVVKTLVRQALKEKDVRALYALVKLNILHSAGRNERGAKSNLAKENARLKKELEEQKAKGSGVLVVPAGVSMDEFLVEAEKHRSKMLEDQAAFSKDQELE